MCRMQVIVRDEDETTERLVQVKRRPLPSDFLLELAAGLEMDAEQSEHLPATSEGADVLGDLDRDASS